MNRILERLADVLKADIHHLIDQAEDPERMLKQVLRDMEDHINAAKQGVIQAIASEKQLFRQLQDQYAHSHAWADRAEYALKREQEDMARTALARKLEYDRSAAELKTAWTSAKQTAERLRDQLKALEAKKADAWRRRNALIARQRAAKAQQSLSLTLARFSTGVDTQTRFTHLESRISEAEAEAEAMLEVLDESTPAEQSFAEQEKEMQVTEELAALKEKIKIYPAKTPW